MFFYSFGIIHYICGKIIAVVIIMKTNLSKTLKSGGVGVIIGLVNGMLGAGGGMVAVPMLSKLGLDAKSAHANAVAVILPITAVSAALYLFKGYVDIGSAWVYMPTGVIAAGIGTLVLKKISPVWLKRIFGGFMVYAGVRLLLK